MVTPRRETNMTLKFAQQRSSSRFFNTLSTSVRDAAAAPLGTGVDGVLSSRLEGLGESQILIVSSEAVDNVLRDCALIHPCFIALAKSD